MAKTELLCGKKTVEIELPYPATVLEMKTLEELSDHKDAVHNALALPITRRKGLDGEEFSFILRAIQSPQEFVKGYCDPKDFVIDQWCAQSIYQATEQAGEVYIYSPGLTVGDVKGMGAFKIDNVQNTINELLMGKEDVVVIPDGPYVIGMVD